ncbi:MAG: preprotein translocase subunit SecE [Candidatus Omnitrophica bacterium]|nr:preprotein translocase subunit SecE [Candidatus Omnitrophota bacterium]
MNIFTKTFKFLKETRRELSKVSWSTREELLEATCLVIVITSIMGLFIGIVDLVLSKILSVMFK